MTRAALSQAVNRAWYGKAGWLWLAAPLLLLYRLITGLRRLVYRLGIKQQWQPPVPVIVVGNVTVGGTGKTPLVIALVEQLRQQGFNPAVVSRGYGSQAPQYPFAVMPASASREAGDEALLIAQRTQAPVVIDSDRVAAVAYCLNHFDSDVIVSDDGLQHYRLGRAIECVVVDGQRGFGNGQCLPVGPLREPLTRLNAVDMIVCNGAAIDGLPVPSYTMQLQSRGLRNLATGETLSAADWRSEKTVHAVAGIGNPQRFFAALRQQGFEVIEHPLADHHDLTPDELNFTDHKPVIMTEKDAVKLDGAVSDNWWVVPVDADIAPAFYNELVAKLAAATG